MFRSADVTSDFKQALLPASVVIVLDEFFTTEARETQRNGRDADVWSVMEFSERISGSVS